MKFLKDYRPQVVIASISFVMIVLCLIVAVYPKDKNQESVDIPSSAPALPEDAMNVSEIPVFVNSLEECTNIYQKYVLPDGCLYECVYNNWRVVEQYLPEYWMNELEYATEEINSLKSTTSEDTFQFILTSDLHISNASKYVQSVGKINAQMMSACGIPYYMDLGDFSSQTTDVGIGNFKKTMQDVLNYLEPINTDRFLLAAGNHDGATGKRVIDGTTQYYCNLLTSDQRADAFYGWQKTNPNKKFGPDGTYYYIDDTESKTRYILLDSYWSGWEGAPDGYVEDEENSFFETPFFGQKQLEWLASEALNMPEGYSAIIGTHNANEQRDIDILKGIIKAFENKSTYNGSYYGKYDWQNINISVDFRSSKGGIIAIFHGHVHKDAIDTESFVVPYIGITSASGHDRREGGEIGTVEETAIDIVTIDKKNRKIHLTRLGVGENRTVNY